MWLQLSLCSYTNVHMYKVVTSNLDALAIPLELERKIIGLLLFFSLMTLNNNNWSRGFKCNAYIVVKVVILLHLNIEAVKK